MASARKGCLKRLEQRFEWALWPPRLIAIPPVGIGQKNTVANALALFVSGTDVIARAPAAYGQASKWNEPFVAELLGAIVSGIDLYLIGIALLIFGYGVYELLISPIEAAREHDQGGGGLLDIRNLDQLKKKLVKVLVVALIVSAFKAMLTMPINDGPSLAFFSLNVLLLALSGYLVTGNADKVLPR